MSTFNVVIKRYGSDEIVDTTECGSERSAEKVERGVNINMNHEDYYTTIEEAA